MSATQPPARATAPPNKRVLALGARANITAATRTAPKTSLSSTDKKATTEKRLNQDASKASIRPLRTTTQPTTAVRKPASTSRTAAKVPIRSSTALPRARIPIPATSASTKPRPVKRVASTSQNDDDFGACDISHILDADSAKDLDVRDASLSLGGRSAAAGRRATNFAGSSEPDKKRASIYAGPVRVIKKNPNATIPIMPVFSNQHPQIARRNVAAIRQHMEVEDAPIQLQKTKSTLKREELERSEPKTLAKNEAVDNDGAEEVASLPDTPSRTISRPTGPKRVLRANPQQPTEINTPHRETLKTTSGGGNLADAIAKASLFRANSLPIHQQISSASAAGSVQIVQTPRRIIDQKKAREFGMAVMDLDFPSPIRVAPKGGQLFHKPSDSPGLFKPIGTPRRVKSSSISLSNIENEMPQKSSLVSQGKPLIPQVERASSATGTDRPRMLLPNPFEVLGIAQPLKTSLRDNEPEHPKTNLNETKAETSQLGGVDLLPHDQSKAAVETNQVSWKKVSPRRSDESAISAGGDYRSGVRAAASVSTLSNSQTSHSPLAVSNDSANLNLHDLEAQFRQIAGQLLNRGASNGQATENVLPDSKLNVKSCASNGSLENSSTNSEAVAASAILPSVFDWQASLTRDGNGGVGTGNSEITENDNDHVESEAADDMKHAQNNINGVVEKQPKDDTYADQSMIDTALDELDEEEERVLMEIMKLNASIS